LYLKIYYNGYGYNFYYRKYGYYASSPNASIVVHSGGGGAGGAIGGILICCCFIGIVVWCSMTGRCKGSDDEEIVEEEVVEEVVEEEIIEEDFGQSQPAGPGQYYQMGNQ
jgi:hypothetical protein